MSSMGFSTTNYKLKLQFSRKEHPQSKWLSTVKLGSVKISSYNWVYLDFIKAFDASHNNI